MPLNPRASAPPPTRLLAGGTVGALAAALLAVLPAGPAVAVEEGLVLHYPLDQTSGTTVVDASGNGRTGTLVGGGTWEDGSLLLDGSDDHVDLPDDLLAGMEAISVSLEVQIAADQATPYFIWGLGNTTDGVGDGYLFTTGDAYRTSIASGNWTTEQTVSAGTALPREVWQTLTYTLDATGTARLYRDGVQVAEETGLTLRPGDIGAGQTAANYLGRSVYAADRYLDGRVRDLRIYDRALTPAEVGELGGDPTAITGVELATLKVAAIVDATTGTVTLPVEPGTDLTTLDPTFTVWEGSTVTPSGPQDWTAPVDVTVTSAAGETRTWTVSAVEMRSPVLPGLYADPNIAVFDGVFYIYATSDGYPGWGGTEFYVWSSTDLVTWERSEEPFLTLDGANGDVPWATGNAWAPTIIERDGKYYFYFSGHNAALNRKTIGVAVADHPEGPFVAQPTAMIRNDEAVTSGQAIDPAAFMDPATGKYFLFWGNGSPVYAELSDDMLSIKQETIARVSGLTDFREGPFLNYRDGLYHLTYAIDDTGSPNYRVGYATSTSVHGPWTYRGLVLEKDTSLGILGPGHSSIVQVPGTDEWYIAYHRFAIPGGDGTHRETTIDRLTFGEDGLIEDVVPTLSSVDPLVAVPVDTTAPTVSATVDAEARTVTVTATDDMAGDLTVEYRLGATGDWLAYTGPVTVGDAAVTVQFRATDAAGNVSAVGSVEVPAVDEPWTPPVFVDVQPGHRFYADIRWLADNGLSLGTELGDDTWFYPTAPMSRQAMAAFMYRYAGADWTPAAGTQTFTDVGPGHQFYVQIEWMVEMGLSTGYVDGTYGPTNAVSRQAMAAFLHRWAGSPEPAGASSFPDVTAANRFAEAIAWLEEAQIAQGYEDGTFGTTRPITRQAMAAFLHRYDQLG